MEEQELVTRAQAGDFEAFGLLVDANKAKVYAMARRLAGNSEDAEDIVQETFLKAIDKIDQFRGESAFGTWLTAIALNMGRAHFAKQKKADLKPIEDYLPGKGSATAHDHSTASLFDWKDPHSLLETEELRSTVDQAISDLPYKYREAFVLRYIEELSIKEVARLTGQTEASAKSRVLRARLALRDSLSTEFEEQYGSRMS